MTRVCTVCSHENRAGIDFALLSVTAVRSIKNLNGLTHPSVIRHRENHLPTTLLKAQEAEEIADADNLLAEIRDLQRKTYGILEKAEAAEDLRTALGAIREARGNLELLAKLAQLIDDRPQINLHISPEWLELRAVIVTALDAHPEAQQSVLRAIEGTHAIEGTAGVKHG